jgi:hypothetical protein
MTNYVASVYLPVTLDLLPNSCRESNSPKGERLALSACAIRQSVGYPRNVAEVSEGEMKDLAPITAVPRNPSGGGVT